MWQLVNKKSKVKIKEQRDKNWNEKKSLTCPLLLLYTLIYLLLLYFSCPLRATALPMDICSHSSNPCYFESQSRNSVLNGNLLPIQFNSSVSSLHCTVQRFYRIPYTFGKATIATNGCSTTEDANHSKIKKIKKNQGQSNLRLHFRKMTEHKLLRGSLFYTGIAGLLIG